MLASARRHLLIITLLLVAVSLTWGQRLSSASRPSPGQLAEQQDETGETALDAALLPQHTYFLDVEGWYRITPYESVVRSDYDLTGQTTEAIASAIPTRLGEWQQVGPDRYVGDDPAVVFYLNHPTVALERSYADPSGQAVTLTIIGNRGEDSFLLFSHTPETCYPGRLWQVVDKRQESILIDGQPVHAQYLLTEHAETGQQLMVLFWYLWDDPQRDSEDGVLSMRVNLYIAEGESQEETLARAWEFVRELFPVAMQWDRF